MFCNSIFERVMVFEHEHLYVICNGNPKTVLGHACSCFEMKCNKFSFEECFVS